MRENLRFFQFYGDANEAESWMKEKRPLVGSSDTGRDAHTAGALLARHRYLHSPPPPPPPD